mgnify:CR=1 FL=1
METMGAFDGAQTHDWLGLKPRAYHTNPLPFSDTISPKTFHLKHNPVKIMVLLGGWFNF